MNITKYRIPRNVNAKVNFHLSFGLTTSKANASCRPVKTLHPYSHSIWNAVFAGLIVSGAQPPTGLSSKDRSAVAGLELLREHIRLYSDVGESARVRLIKTIKLMVEGVRFHSDEGLVVAKRYLRGPIWDRLQGPWRAAQFGRTSRALPPPPASVKEVAIKNLLKDLTSGGSSQPWLLRELDAYVRQFCRSLRDTEMEVSIPTGASYSMSRREGGAVAELISPVSGPNETANDADKARFALASVSYEILTGPNLFKGRPAVVLAPGYKTRPLSCHPAAIISRGQSIRKYFWPVLDDVIDKTDKYDASRVFREAKWLKTDIISADLSSATDLMHQDVALTVIRSLIEERDALSVRGLLVGQHEGDRGENLPSWVLETAEALLGPCDIKLPGSPTPVTTSRGILQGSPLSWLVLCLVNRFAVYKADKRVTPLIKGDDALFAGNARVQRRYESVLTELGLKLNVSKTWRRKNLGFFAETIYVSGKIIPTIPLRVISSSHTVTTEDIDGLRNALVLCDPIRRRPLLEGILTCRPSLAQCGLPLTLPRFAGGLGMYGENYLPPAATKLAGAANAAWRSGNSAYFAGISSSWRVNDQSHISLDTSMYEEKRAYRVSSYDHGLVKELVHLVNRRKPVDVKYPSLASVARKVRRIIRSTYMPRARDVGNACSKLLPEVVHSIRNKVLREVHYADLKLLHIPLVPFTYKAKDKIVPLFYDLSGRLVNPPVVEQYPRIPQLVEN